MKKKYYTGYLAFAHLPVRLLARRLYRDNRSPGNSLGSCDALKPGCNTDPARCAACTCNLRSAMGTLGETIAQEALLRNLTVVWF